MSVADRIPASAVAVGLSITGNRRIRRRDINAAASAIGRLHRHRHRVLGHPHAHDHGRAARLPSKKDSSEEDSTPYETARRRTLKTVECRGRGIRAARFGVRTRTETRGSDGDVEATWNCGATGALGREPADVAAGVRAEPGRRVRHEPVVAGRALRGFRVGNGSDPARRSSISAAMRALCFTISRNARSLTSSRSMIVPTSSRGERSSSAMASSSSVIRSVMVLSAIRDPVPGGDFTEALVRRSGIVPRYSRRTDRAPGRVTPR